ncbi:MAG: hypothetical protein JWN98_1032 [Abditibacteriota bacterium]|nr:hypothetical protein [Abditibacteriota bacterium]
MNKVLCTGASGFIGRHCLPLLVRAGYHVHAVRSAASSTSYAIKTHALETPESGFCGAVQWHTADLLEAHTIEQLLSQTQPTHLLHLAWAPAIPGQFWDTSNNFRWVQASLSLLQSFAAHGGQRVVAAGTCAEYDWELGSRVGTPFRENGTPLRPASVYGTCKHALQLMMSAWAQQNELSQAWGRVFFAYGPHEYPERLVASVIRALLSGEPAPCSHGEQMRDFLHVADIAAAFVALLDSPAQGPVNIASGRAVAVKEIVCEISSILQRPELIQLGARPTPPNEPEFLVAETSRLNLEIGWTPKYDLHSGLEHTINWWKAQATG